MSNLNLHNITNSFRDVHLASLSTWKDAAQFEPKDRGGPYVVLQPGYDPEDLKFTPDEFILGRSGKWIPVGHFYQLPIPERRAEFVFGTAAEVMDLMGTLPPKVQILRPATAAAAEPPASDELAAAIATGRKAADTAPGN